MLNSVKPTIPEVNNLYSIQISKRQSNRNLSPKVDAISPQSHDQNCRRFGTTISGCQMELSSILIFAFPHTSEDLKKIINHRKVYDFGKKLFSLHSVFLYRDFCSRVRQCLICVKNQNRGFGLFIRLFVSHMKLLFAVLISAVLSMRRSVTDFRSLTL